MRASDLRGLFDGYQTQAPPPRPQANLASSSGGAFGSGYPGSGASTPYQHTRAGANTNFHQSAPPGIGAPTHGGQAVGQRSKAVAAALALFLGWLGIHRFYLGRWTTGSIMLAIWMLRWVLLRIGSMIGWMSFNRALTFATFIDGAAKARDLVIIWALIDFVLILTGRLKDGQGYGLG